MPTRRHVPSILLALLTAVLVVVTIGPVGQRLAGEEAPLGVLSLEQWLVAETWTNGALSEFAANVLLFVPWGVLALLVVGERRWWLAAALGAALTLAIEIGQIPLPRISDPRDLVANSLGVLVGIGIAVVVRRSRALRAPVAGRAPGLG